MRELWRTLRDSGVLFDALLFGIFAAALFGVIIWGVFG